MFNDWHNHAEGRKTWLANIAWCHILGVVIPWQKGRELSCKTINEETTEG